MVAPHLVEAAIIASARRQAVAVHTVAPMDGKTLAQAGRRGYNSGFPGTSCVGGIFQPIFFVRSSCSTRLRHWTQIQQRSRSELQRARLGPGAGAHVDFGVQQAGANEHFG